MSVTRIDSYKGHTESFLTKIPSSKRWIYKDNLVISCNNLYKYFGKTIELQTMATIVENNIQDGETLLEASERIKRLLRDPSEDTLLLLNI